MSEVEKVYQFNEYILSYDKSLSDRSCLTISKTQNGNIYVMSELLDGSADVVSMILDSLQITVNYCKQENKQLKENNRSMQEEMVRTWEKLDDLQQIEQEHQKINGELREENKKYKEVIDKAIDLIEKSGTTDIGIDSNNNIIHYHQLTEDETGELLDILKEVSK